MRIRSRTLLSVALVATLALLGAACGSDDEDSSGDATTTTAAELEPCAEAYVAGDGAAEGPEVIDDRGAPDLVGCEPSGELEIIDEIEGSGAEVPAGATVTVQYSGVAAATGEEFDSSWSRGEAATFPLGRVIPGWTEGMVGMKEGGRRTLVVPPELGYGDSGPAPGDSLVFTIDLVSVDAGGGVSTTAVAG